MRLRLLLTEREKEAWGAQMNRPHTTGIGAETAPLWLGRPLGGLVLLLADRVKGVAVVIQRVRLCCLRLKYG